MNYILQNNRCVLESLPFYWHPLDNENNHNFSKKFPFELIIDDHLGILRQKPHPAVLRALETAYNDGSEIAGLMDGSDIGSRYAQDFINYIEKTYTLERIKDKEILEIGCGTGYLLHHLKRLGGNVLGYEPGFSKIGKYDVPVIRKFFPSPEIAGKTFDLIMAYQVLEHVVDIEKFFADITSHLKDTGMLILSVPDCAACIEQGDISMLLHEHFSYFTQASFKRLLNIFNFEILDVEKSKYGGSIYAALQKRKSERQIPHVGPVDELTQNVFGKLNDAIQNFENFLTKHRNQTLGIFVPIRALNILHLSKHLISESNIQLRFFDDAPGLTGKYLPGFKIIIENRDTLINHPPETVLIYSYSFGEKIRNELLRSLPKTMELKTISEIRRHCEDPANEGRSNPLT